MVPSDGIIRIASEKMTSEFSRILRKYGFDIAAAHRCAEIFTSNTADGVHSHGIYRFPRFVKNTIEGYVKPAAIPSLIQRAGALEQWNGNLGPGPLNANFATERSMEIAGESGIGLVTLANTNHWMRGGTYGWQAAKKGFVLICWTNTCQNMPAWGGTDPRIGNNPMVIAVPFHDEAIVLDFAMSQYSYGRLESVRKAGDTLPFPGGFNKEGKLTNDPGEIMDSWRVLPTGYWKGAGLSLLLDILATILSGGLSTHEITDCRSEHSVSQVFIAINIRALPNFPSMENSIRMIIEDLHKSVPQDESTIIRHPGENVLRIREDSRQNGIAVNTSAWERILNL